MNFFFLLFRIIIIIVCFLSCPLIIDFSGLAYSQPPVSDTTPQPYNIHFQNTIIDQYHPAFNAKYSGNNSLSNKSEHNNSITVTLYAGLRLLKNSSIYIVPELSGGTGFSKAHGIAGFTNGEVVRVSTAEPVIYLSRLFFKQVFNISPDTEYVKDDIDQLSCRQGTSRINVVLGKFSVLDFFDDNSFTHDPRTQFMNWSLMTDGAWDYPADTRGYTIGGILEYINPYFSIRGCAAMVSTTPNGSVYDTRLSQANGLALEFEKPYNINNYKGTARILAYRNITDAGTYNEVNFLTQGQNDIKDTRKYGTVKYGFGLNIEQELSDGIAVFLRAGWNDGATETWMFTQIDRSISFGANFNGILWKRVNDEFALAFVINGLSGDQSGYLSKGGYGFIIGDGTLNYGAETIFEAYYKFSLIDLLNIYPDYQFVLNPAYNKDRGPVYVFSLRLHIEI